MRQRQFWKLGESHTTCNLPATTTNLCIAAVVGAHRGVRRSYSCASYRRVSTSLHNIGLPNSTPRAGGASGCLSVCLIDADMHVHPQSRIAPHNFTLARLATNQRIGRAASLAPAHRFRKCTRVFFFSPRVSYACCVMVDIATVKSPSVFLMHKSGRKKDTRTRRACDARRACGNTYDAPPEHVACIEHAQCASYVKMSTQNVETCWRELEPVPFS